MKILTALLLLWNIAAPAVQACSGIQVPVSVEEANRRLHGIYADPHTIPLQLSQKPAAKDPTRTLAVYAATDDRAEAIEKIMKEKYCKETACTTVIVRVMGFHPSERDFGDQVMRALDKKIKFVGLDYDMWRGGGVNIRLQDLRERGAVIQSISFLSDGGKKPVEVCDADAGGPGCGGD